MKPGVRLGDDHKCPSIEHGPHIGGPVVTLGCDTVLMERKASARGGDIALCRVATDVIVKGSSNVWIGGMPAARLDEACLHGGKVTTGAAEVFIGGEAIDPPNIDKIIENVKEMDELWRKLKEQREELKKRSDYIKGPQPLPIPFISDPAAKLINKWLKEAGKHPSQPQDHPPGMEDYSKEEADQLERAWEERERISKKMGEDLDRIRELERQNREMQKGKPPVAPTPGGPGGIS